MAISQYVTYLVPASAVRPDGTLPGVVVDGDGFELPPLTFPFSPAQFERVAADYLPPAKSWSEKVRAWGDGEKDDLELFAEDGRAVEIRARLDLRDRTIERVRELLRFARALQCCFVEGRKGVVFAATEAALLDSIRTSRPAAFVADPRGFLERLSRDAAPGRRNDRAPRRTGRGRGRAGGRRGRCGSRAGGARPRQAGRTSARDASMWNRLRFGLLVLYVALAAFLAYSAGQQKTSDADGDNQGGAAFALLGILALVFYAALRVTRATAARFQTPEATRPPRPPRDDA